MSGEQDQKPNRPKPIGGADREMRIKANLRANLHRRKQKARALKAQENEDSVDPNKED